MKNISTLFFLLIAAVSSLFAAEAISNSKVYTLTTDRGFLLYYEGRSTICGSNATAFTAPSASTSDVNQMFAVLTDGTKQYLWSVGARKFVCDDGSFSETPAQALTMTATTSSTRPWFLKIGNNGINMQEKNQMAAGVVVNSWVTQDAGNRFTFTEAEMPADLDLSSILKVELPVEITDLEGHYFYLKNLGREGYYMRSYPLAETDYVAEDGNIRLGRTTQKVDSASVWKFELESGSRYYISNYKGEYIGAIPTTNDVRVAMTDRAGAYAYTVEKNSNGYFIIYDASSSVTQKALYMTSWDGVVRGKTTDTYSQWTLQWADEDLDSLRWNDQTYVLVFHDEFDSSSTAEEYNSNYWQPQVAESACWNRFCSDDPDVCFMKDGTLHCLAIPVTSSTMKTGAVHSQGKKMWKYGRFEARIKTNPYSGNFPAFWMMPNDNVYGGWPYSGEIDIWEQINTEKVAYGTVHTQWTYGGDSGCYGMGGNSGNIGNIDYSQWHVFAMQWDESSITWYVDGSTVWTYTKSTDATTLSKGQWPFDQTFYLILNQSVGNGDWAYNPDYTHTYETEFDWVRVYQQGHATDPLAEATVPDVVNDLLNGGKTYDINHSGSITISDITTLIQRLLDTAK